MGPVENNMRAKLEKAFAIEALEIVNESHRHQGHAEKPQGDETHFKVRMITPDFEGLSRMERHRKVFAVLEEEMIHPIHALSLELKTPQEVKK